MAVREPHLGSVTKLLQARRPATPGCRYPGHRRFLAGMAICWVLGLAGIAPFQTATADPPEGVGVYQPSTGTFHLRQPLSTGPAELSFRIQGTAKAQAPAAGDWDGDGTATVGLYRRGTRSFRLRNENTAGPVDATLRLQQVRAGLLPIAGDWDRDGNSTVGVYDPARQVFSLLNTLDTGAADLEFRFEGAKKPWRPVAGDWDGDGYASVGLYDPKTATFHLRNSNTTGPAELQVTIQDAESPAGWLPVVGDWNGDGQTSVGLFHPGKRMFRLRNLNIDGPADIELQLQGIKKGGIPLAGYWRSPSESSAARSCVDTINAYRATLSLTPLARWTEAEACADDQARSDSETGKAHGAFGQCQEFAQNECPGWPGPPESMIGGCLQMMWAEGPGSDFSKHGHYINMSNAKYAKVACGFYTTPEGAVWSVQDFR